MILFNMDKKMKKILLIITLSIIFVLSFNVRADMIFKARIGNEYYDSLEEAILNATSNDTIILTSDNVLDNTININKNVNINLNNHNIEANEKVFLVEGGSLNISGKGKIRETKPYYGAIVMVGSNSANDVDYSTISIDENVTLEGWSGIFIDHNDSNKAYGILVNMNGKINALNDTTGDTGVGIYVNGNIKHDENAPVINLSDTAMITSTGFGIYSAGNANYYINGSHIEGIEAGIGLKSGKVKILDGEILGTGPNKIPTTGNNNGINPSGAAIQIESNKGYFGNIEIDIRDGLLQSEKSHVIYEYTVNGSPTQIKSISLSGGKYDSKSSLDVFKMSDSFNGSNNGFISGGVYSSSPSNYLKDGFSVNVDGTVYEVVNNELRNEIPLIGIGIGTNFNILYSVIFSIIILIMVFGYLKWINKKY